MGMQDCYYYTCCLSWTLDSWLELSLLKFFCGYYFGRCSSKLAQLVPLPYFCGKFYCCSDYMIFLSLFLYVIRMSLSTLSFLAQLRLWKCLAVECFPFSYDLKGFKFTISSHLLSLGSVLTAFLYAFNLLGLVNLNLKKCNHEFFEVKSSDLLQLKTYSSIYIFTNVCWNITWINKSDAFSFLHLL